MSSFKSTITYLIQLYAHLMKAIICFRVNALMPTKLTAMKLATANKISCKYQKIKMHLLKKKKKEISPRTREVVRNCIERCTETVRELTVSVAAPHQLKLTFPILIIY